MEETLETLKYVANRQRIDLKCRLGHFDRSQVEAYIVRHLAYAEQREIFSRLVRLMKSTMHKHRIIDDHMIKRVIAGELA
jgi:general secretion pathway protein A